MEEMGLDPDDPAPSIAGKMLDVRILKSRRQGVTTLLLALIFLDTYNNNNRRSIAIAQDLDATQVIFEIVTRYYNNLPEPMRIEAARANTRELVWPSIDSRFYVETANKPNVGSGATLHNVLKDERAKWNLPLADIRAADASLDLACLKGNKFEPSTAFGMNHFKFDWDASTSDVEEERDPAKAIFIPWFKDPLCVLDLPEGGITRTREEQEWVEIYGLNDKQINWYRAMKKERKELLCQEYPFTPLEAFITSGHPVFNRKKLQNWDARLHKTIDEGGGPLKDLIIPHDFPRLRDAYRDGKFKIFRTPEYEQTESAGMKDYYLSELDPYKKPQLMKQPKRYLITADVAEGKNPEKGDFDCAHVYDIDTREQVATLHGKWDVTYYGKMLAELGWMYFEALLAPEANNHGIGAMAGIVEMEYPQNRGLTNLANGLYYFRAEHINQTLKVSAMETLKPGWPTFRQSKHWAIDQMSNCIEEDEMIIRDPETIKELSSFVHMGQGTMGGESNAHDDHVTCCWIAAALLRLRYGRFTRTSTIQPREPSGGYGSMRAF